MIFQNPSQIDFVLNCTGFLQCEVFVETFSFLEGGGGKFQRTIPTPPLTKRENHD